MASIRRDESQNAQVHTGIGCAWNPVSDQRQHQRCAGKGQRASSDAPGWRRSQAFRRAEPGHPETQGRRWLRRHRGRDSWTRALRATESSSASGNGSCPRSRGRIFPTRKEGRNCRMRYARESRERPLPIAEWNAVSHDGRSLWFQPQASSPQLPRPQFCTLRRLPKRVRPQRPNGRLERPRRMDSRRAGVKIQSCSSLERPRRY